MKKNILLLSFLSQFGCASSASVQTGITWSSEPPKAEKDKDRLNFKPRTSVDSLEELTEFLNDQMNEDQMSVVISFFEPAQIKAQSKSYLKFLRAGGAPNNSMVAFALCTNFDTARTLKIPAPLPVSVFFSPAANEVPGLFEMRQAKFFEDGQVFLDGMLPILAYIEGGNEVSKVRFPTSIREAMGKEEGVRYEDEEVAGDEEEQIENLLESASGVHVTEH